MNIDKRNDILKLIAAISMFIDHIGAVYYPDVVIFRIIGRIAFPIFAYYIANGFMHTSNLNKYIFRIFLAAILTQIPFSLFAYVLMDTILYLNVLFTFLLALILLYTIKNKYYILSVLILIFPILLEILTSTKMDYGTYGILMILLFYLLKENKTLRNMSIVFLTIAYSFIQGVPFYNSVQIYCLFALPILDYINRPYIILPRYFFYLFYPIHIAGIVLLYSFCNIVK